MARALIVCCGCRGRALGHRLAAAGHAVRGTSRTEAGTTAIREAGIEPHVADPDRIATLMGALVGVSVVCWLAGTPTGDPRRAEALHDGRLRMLLEKVVDTPVRGVVYEAAGTLAPEVYARGRAIALRAHETWAMPVAVLDADPAAHGAWLDAAAGAVEQVLSAR